MNFGFKELKAKIFLSTLVFVFLPAVVLAQGGNNTALTWFLGIVNRFFGMVLWPVFTALAVIMFIYAGILFLTAFGDASKLEKAKKAIIWAVVGIVIALLALMLSNIVNIVLPNQQVSNCKQNGEECQQGTECCSNFCHDRVTPRVCANQNP